MEDVRRLYRRDGLTGLYVAAFGKAAHDMCRAAEYALDDIITAGVAVTKYGHSGRLNKIEILEASHPLPDENGVYAADRIVGLLKKSDRKTLVLCLISGGGSALLISPQSGISLEEKKIATDLLLKSGADIVEINSVRKHISKVKGGRLAAAAAPSKVVSLILSDVIGDPIDTIASGPTSPDGSTYDDALKVLHKYNLTKTVPQSIISFLKKGRNRQIEETPKPGNRLFNGVQNIIIANNKAALTAAKKRAEKLGFAAQISSMAVVGEAAEAGRDLAAKALKIKKRFSGRPLCLISGGETTVTVTGTGKGGRNMELALAFACEIEGGRGVTLLSAGTDGTDGPTDAAGAIVDGQTVARAKASGYEGEVYLKNNDSYTFFKRAGGLFITGPTGTNVMDIQVVIVK